MNATVLIEFCVPHEQYGKFKFHIDKLGDDFQRLSHTAGGRSNMIIITGKINAEVATLLSLGDDYLSKIMRISQITDVMKDAYRQGKH